MTPWKAGLLGVVSVFLIVGGIVTIGAIFGPTVLGLALVGCVWAGLLACIGWAIGVGLWGRE